MADRLRLRSPNHRPNPGHLALLREKTLIGLLLLYPMLAEEMAERIMEISMRDNALDSLRNQILSVVATHSDLDASRLVTQLLEGVASAPDMTAMISSTILSARTAIPAAGSGDDNAMEEAHAAVTDLLQSLESDSVSADLRRQAAIIEDESGAYDRFTRALAAERRRLVDGQG